MHIPRTPYPALIDISDPVNVGQPHIRPVPLPPYLRLRASRTRAILGPKRERVLFCAEVAKCSHAHESARPLLCPATCRNEEEATHACARKAPRVLPARTRFRTPRAVRVVDIERDVFSRSWMPIAGDLSSLDAGQHAIALPRVYRAPARQRRRILTYACGFASVCLGPGSFRGRLWLQRLLGKYLSQSADGPCQGLSMACRR